MTETVFFFQGRYQDHPGKILSPSGPSHLEFDSGKRFDGCCPRVSNRGLSPNKCIVNGKKLPFSSMGARVSTV